MTTKNDIFEPLHITIQLKFKLASIFFTKLFTSTHGAHFVDPFRHHSKPTIPRRKVRISLQSTLDLAQSWQEFVDGANIKCEDIHWCNEFRCDIENSLGQVSVGLLASVVWLSWFQKLLRLLAMLDIVLHYKVIYSSKTLNRLRTEYELMVKAAELAVVLWSHYFSWHVCILLIKVEMFRQQDYSTVLYWLTRYSIVLMIEYRFCSFSYWIYYIGSSMNSESISSTIYLTSLYFNIYF